MSQDTVGTLAGSDNKLFLYRRKSMLAKGNPVVLGQGVTDNDIMLFDASRVARTSTETRPTNTALSPRIIAY